MFDSLKQWRDAQQHLDAAIQSYLKCLYTLSADVHSHLRTIDVSSLESIALEIQNDFFSMESRHEQLTKGERVLGGILNKSTSIAPIGKIHNEVLLEILRTSAWEVTHFQHPYFDSWLCFDRHYSFSKLLRLTHVCAGWRQTIIETSSFWEYVDMWRFNIFERANAVPCVQLVLERSVDRPLCLDLAFPSNPNDEAPPGPILPAVKFLSPHMHRMQSLYLGRYQDIMDVVDFLSLWFNTTSVATTPLHTLAIWRDPDPELDDGETFVYDPTEHQKSTILLLPIRVLRLNGFVFEWTSTAYQNLIHLHIDNLSSENSPSIDEIIDILAACPELQILQLTDMFIKEGKRHYLQPVPLSHLKILDLNYLGLGGVGLLLPLLVVPQTRALSFKLSILPPSHACGLAALAFLARTNVNRLSVTTPGGEDHLEKYLSTARNVEILILDLGCGDGDRALSAMARVPSSLCTGIHTFYICNGSFKETSLRNVFKKYSSIRKLRDIECGVETEDGQSALVEELQDLIPDSANLWSENQDIETRWYDIMT